MFYKILAPLMAIPLGLMIAVGVDGYADSFRSTQVMSMAEEIDPLVSVPQPIAYVVPVTPVQEAPQVHISNVSTTYYYQCNSRSAWWQRGPVRRCMSGTVRTGGRVFQGIGRSIGWIFGSRRYGW